MKKKELGHKFYELCNKVITFYNDAMPDAHAVVDLLGKDHGLSEDQWQTVNSTMNDFLSAVTTLVNSVMPTVKMFAEGSSNDKAQ